MRADLGYGWWVLKYEVRRWFTQTLPWKLAWMLPRKVALLAFVRVFSAGTDSPDDSYQKAYQEWERGAGR